MNERMQVIVGVQEAISSYAYALDAGRTEDIVALFTSDAVVNLLGQGSFSGHDEIRAAYSNFVPKGPQRHVTANVLVTSWEGDRATAVGDLVYLERGDAGWVVCLVGRYEDVLRRDGDKWLFEERVLSYE